MWKMCMDRLSPLKWPSMQLWSPEPSVSVSNECAILLPLGFVLGTLSTGGPIFSSYMVVLSVSPGCFSTGSVLFTVFFFSFGLGVWFCGPRGTSLGHFSLSRVPSSTTLLPLPIRTFYTLSTIYFTTIAFLSSLYLGQECTSVGSVPFTTVSLATNNALTGLTVSKGST